MKCPQCYSANWLYVEGRFDRFPRQPFGSWMWDRHPVTAANVARWLKSARLDLDNLHEFALCRECGLEVS